MTDLSQYRPAATVVLIRNKDENMEVLLLKRNPKIKFMGGSWVFPGGGVDEADCAANIDRYSEAAGRVAAVRETDEEAGLTINSDDLLCISHWTAPKEAPRRYSTWFYMTAMPESQEVRVDGNEIIDHRWLKATDALDLRKAGELVFLPPTFVTLEWLSSFNSSDKTLDHYRLRQPQIFGPKLIINGDDVVNVYEEDAAFHSNDLNTVGARHRFIMGKDEWRYESVF